MPTANFGTKNDPSFQLEQSPDLIAVRTQDRRPIPRSIGSVRTPLSGELDDAALVASYPDAGVEVYRVPPDSRSVAQRKSVLAAAPEVRFAGHVLVDPVTDEPVLYTENVFVKFADDADPEQCRAVLDDAGLRIKETVDYAVNAYFAAAPEGTGQQVFDIANGLLSRDDVEYSHPELIRKRSHKKIFPQQWHLKATTIGGVAINAHANVEAAHEITRGRGATIAVIDDGVDIDHPEFAGAGKVVAPRDATRETNDPRPRGSAKHGTACAGVACANGTLGASGVAPEARLMPIRLASDLGSQAEARAFKWAVDHGADVISCSWGPEDGLWFEPDDPRHNQVVPLPASTRLAIEHAVKNGRNGKGCAVLFAAGNGNERVENDGYASFPKVIAVAACNDTSKRSVYSDFGKAVWCAFPSSDMGHPPFRHPDPLTTGIWTIDRHGPAGYNVGTTDDGDVAGNFTNSFGGTSSACPGAAGVVALVLSVHPDLTSSEVKDLLKQSCDMIDPQHGAYGADGRSDKYGFGRLNALTAVRTAKKLRGPQ